MFMGCVRSHSQLIVGLAEVIEGESVSVTLKQRLSTGSKHYVQYLVDADSGVALRQAERSWDRVGSHLPRPIFEPTFVAAWR